MGKILVVDDERGMRELLTIMLQKEGFDVSSADGGQEALEFISQRMYDIVITDIKMPNVTGIDVLKAVKETSPETIVIMITAYASTETAMDAMKLGAYDYINKPFKIEEIKLIVRNAFERRRLREENLLLKRKIQEWTLSGVIGGIVGKSPGILRIVELIVKIADSPSNILITGESGTGKELVARAIHNYSNRKEQSFVALNCNAIPEGLLESELFGHVKGAFTGAIASKEGLFETANNGTIFLDEIGDIPHNFQIKILRVLEDRTFKRVGGNQEIKVDVRVVAATNKDLKKAVADGEFREDLFYRLNVIPVEMPPLRDRKEDIPLLIDHFISKYNRILGRNIKKVADDAMPKLVNHPWKGNVRELENVIERIITLGSGTEIDLRSVDECLQGSVPYKSPLAIDVPLEGIDLEGLLNNIEKSLLIKALERSKGVKKDAAELLRLEFRSFRYRLAKYNISKDDE
ncbi:MAG: sigma-54-dependent Fis family transcriptional regulator [Nitrospirae bacterium]|nr:sigma-54-dependent Fis family transcriptional regulator [Nitrospirota bacterium]